MYSEAKNSNCKIYIPEDCNVSLSLEGSGKIKKKGNY